MTVRLRLYISGTSRFSSSAIRHLKEVCDTHLPGRHELEILDVLESPAAAEEDRILATPTLIRLQPDPVRRLVGDLSDREALLFGLDINPSTESQE